ncbi:hypothetical protein AAHC03_027155 [Spirometra sp. Aus1]
MLPPLLTFAFLILHSVSSLAPISGNFLLQSPGKVHLFARLLKDQLTCDFNDLNFCALENNGGWSFQRSLLELVRRLTKTAQSVMAAAEWNRTDAVPPELPASTPPNHYVCADWGVATPSAKMTSSSNLTARLESYVLVPVLRHRRWINFPPSTDRTASGAKAVPSGGRVLYVGPAGSSPFHPKATTTPRSHLRSRRPVEGDGEVLAENQDDCVCLQMDILLPESRTAKLTVRFGPISQSVALPWLEGTWRPDERKITATTTTTTSMFASLVAGIIWPFAFGTGESVRSSTTDHQLPHPPANQWLHLRLPITTRLFPTAFDTTEVNTPPPTPTAFSLHGVAGVCLDDVAFLATKSADCPRSLTWTIASSDNSSTNEILFFNDHGQPLRRASPSLSSGQQRQSGSLGDRVVGGGEATVHVYGSTSRRRGLLEHLLNGAFLFGILLALIVIFVTVGLAVAVACGKRASRNAVDSLRKKKTTFLRETTVLRSPSVCSMPTFAISPMDLPLGSGEQTRSEVCYDRSLSLDSTICSSSVENGLLLDEDSRLPAFRVSSEETSLLDCRSQLRMPSSSSVMINKRRSRRNAPPLTGHSHYLFQSKPAIEPAKRRRPNSSVDCNPALPPNPQPGARLSLLLSINEDSELVLVPQAYNCSNPTSSADGAVHPETVTGQNAIASTTTTLPSEVPAIDSVSAHTTAVVAGQIRPPCQPNHLSDAETEATLAEMAASVGALGAAQAVSSSPYPGRCAPKEVEGEETASVDSCIFEAETLPMYREAVQLLDQMVDGATNPLSLSPSAILDKSDSQS